VPRFAFPVIPYAKKMGKAVVVHLHDYIPVSYTATVLAPYEEHRHRITRDDIALECMKGTKHCMAVNLLWWLPRLARKWITQADKIICVSKRQAEIISDLAPELGSKIGVIYNPPPPELVRARPSKDLNDTPTYLYVGGDGHVKGFYILLRIAKELEKKKIKTGLILAGDYDSENLRILENFNTRSKYVKAIVVGKVIHEELISLHNKSWALFFPSICEETLGYAVVEASLLGTIPVASRVGGVAEILSDTLISNFMFAPNNVAEAVEKCSAICMLSPSEVKNLGYELRSEVLKKFGPDTIKQELLDFFNDVLHS
jgi:glycosyltransferase involved in cell wall biosynthesis